MRAVIPSDWPALREWYASHRAPLPSEGHTPPTGLIEPGVAAGFLVLTDARFALLEGFITNPAAPLRSRSRAVSRIAFALRSEAAASGATRVIALTQVGGIARRASRLGLQPAGTYVMLTGEP